MVSSYLHFVSVFVIDLIVRPQVAAQATPGALLQRNARCALRLKQPA
jgi:hypothetical protein